jgi:Rrf2 family transcriptional regulator, cysteine metabolism repressor
MMGLTLDVKSNVIGQSRLVGTPRCGVRTAQRAVPTFPVPPSLTDYNQTQNLLVAGVFLCLHGQGGFGGTSRIRDSGVKLSVKSDYAARAVLWLCQHYPEGAARTAEEMASAQGIPPNYLVQILIELKAANIVQSQRGKEGGYRLARPPAKITFGDVLRCIHGEIFDSPGLSHPHSPPELRQAWSRLRAAINQEANAITFQQLLENTVEKGKMYYI